MESKRPKFGWRKICKIILVPLEFGICYYLSHLLIQELVIKRRYNVTCGVVTLMLCPFFLNSLCRVYFYIITM